MSEAQARPQWARLAAELRRLRILAGLSQHTLGKATGISQGSVNRIEFAGTADPPGAPPSWPKVQQWARAAGAADPDMGLLRHLTEAALDEHSLFRYRIPAVGLAGLQDEMRGRENVTGRICNFNPWGMPGLLQTPEYARRVFLLLNPGQADNADAAVRARQARQGILADPARKFEFVLTEGALRYRPGPDPVLPEQLAHLAAVAAFPAVNLGVIPFGTVAQAIPYCNVVIYEDRDEGVLPAIAMELPHRELSVDDPSEVEILREWFGLLSRSAVHGDEAVAFVREVARSLTVPDR
jgi:transcriptional regulator with XRE-family HTH domain